MDQKRIDYYFDIVRKLLEYSIDEDCDGVDTLRDEWEYNKSKFFPYFNADGFVESEIEQDYSEFNWDTVLNIINSDLYVQATSMLSSDKNKFTHREILKIGSAIRYLAHYLQNFTVAEIANNKMEYAHVNPTNRDKLYCEGSKISKYLLGLHGYVLFDIDFNGYTDEQKKCIEHYRQLV